MLIYAIAICLVVGPETIIDITVYMNKATFAMSSVLPPFSYVLSSVRPGLLTLAISETTLPFSHIDRSCLKLVRRSLLP
jgi:hypothetical protein